MTKPKKKELLFDGLVYVNLSMFGDGVLHNQEAASPAHEFMQKWTRW